MKKFFVLSLGVLAFASVARADLAKDCFTTDDGGSFCTTDNLGKVQVWVFNAGWCPSCNEEMDQLPAVYEKFSGDPVIFASLSGEGYDHGSDPDTTFLQSWRQQHGIPFIVAGKLHDYGDLYNSPGYIPFTVIVDQSGNIAASGELSGDDVESKVRGLLGKH